VNLTGGTKTFVYDANGNVTADGTRTLPAINSSPLPSARTGPSSRTTVNGAVPASSRRRTALSNSTPR